jgi:hypothetical protein
MNRENPLENTRGRLRDKSKVESKTSTDKDMHKGTSGTQIDKWVISSPERVRIVACGGPGTELVKGIFENYSEKLKGIRHKSFNKPTKPDYLELKLTPDYRNIRSASIKKELESSMVQEPVHNNELDSGTESVPAEPSKLKSGSNIDPDSETAVESGKDEAVQDRIYVEQKISIFNKLKTLLGPRQKDTEDEIDTKHAENEEITASPDNGSGNAPETENADEDKVDSECVPDDDEPREDIDELALSSGQDIRDIKVQQARSELETELNELINETDLIFIVTDLKSTYGLDNSLITAKLAKKNNIITIGLVFLPDSLKKLEEVEYGNRALHSFRLNADIIVAVPYMEKLLEGYTVLIINELLELITTSGLVNLDVADIKTVVGRGNVAMMGFGSGRGYDHNKIMEAINEALNSPLLKIDLNGVNRTLVNVTGDSSMTISEAQKAAKVILSKIQPDARLIWGAAVKPKLKGAIKVMIMAGISPKNILVNIYANS